MGRFDSMPGLGNTGQYTDWDAQRRKEQASYDQQIANEDARNGALRAWEGHSMVAPKSRFDEGMEGTLEDVAFSSALGTLGRLAKRSGKVGRSVGGADNYFDNMGRYNPSLEELDTMGRLSQRAETAAKNGNWSAERYKNILDDAANDLSDFHQGRGVDLYRPEMYPRDGSHRAATAYREAFPLKQQWQKDIGRLRALQKKYPTPGLTWGLKRVDEALHMARKTMSKQSKGLTTAEETAAAWKNYRQVVEETLNHRGSKSKMRRKDSMASLRGGKAERFRPEPPVRDTEMDRMLDPVAGDKELLKGYTNKPVTPEDLTLHADRELAANQDYFFRTAEHHAGADIQKFLDEAQDLVGGAPSEEDMMAFWSRKNLKKANLADKKSAAARFKELESDVARIDNGSLTPKNMKTKREWEAWEFVQDRDASLGTLGRFR